MALREFRDRHGLHWSVCEVHAESSERRRARPDVVYDGPERRRRTDVLYRSPVRDGYEQGWLVFESRAERRRLVPIPQGWEELPEAELERLCYVASPAGRPRRLP
ncbi:MAG TPA: hypothetical protein VEA99_18230 [Gemmatimonadaceae bacterium]|nr:hypothetical protein [Gemmatimonadaceae bacterium]